jgi:protein Tex
LDASAVHPEAYSLVEAIAADLKTDVQHLIGNEAALKGVQPKQYATETVGELTIKDILKELTKPGLDPRSELEQFQFAAIYKIEEVQVGMVVPGVVTNLTRFGAFVDIGVKQDGLVHVSEMAHRYISDPTEVVKLNDKVMVKVMEVDIPRSRIALSIKPERTSKTLSTHKLQPQPAKQPQRRREEDLSGLSVNDALAALKKKFGKG